MTVYCRIELSECGDWAVVRMLDRIIRDSACIEELGKELWRIIDREKKDSILLDFAGVEFLSSAALQKLIILDQKLKMASGRLRLCNMKPEIYEVFAITRLNQLFDIKRTQLEACM